MKKNQLLSVLMTLCVMTAAHAQSVRYLNRVFTDTTRTTIVYGYNWTVLGLARPAPNDHMLKQPLVAEVVMPKGDTAPNRGLRPLAICLHTGNFLPFPQNLAATGSYKDSSILEICKRLAQMGYVAASADYRTGWSPLDSSQTTRVFTLINAAYRGIQDVRNCIRYFKANSALFGIDTNKILVVGQGTGGYISLGVASFDRYSEILSTTHGANKFIVPGTNPPIPMVIQALNGDVNGTSTGVSPGPPNYPIPAGDSLCSINYPNNTSNVQLVVNLGGAIGDISWLEASSTPIVSFQNPADPFAPYEDDILNVGRPAPATPLPVVRVQGALLIQRKADLLGLNNMYDAIKPQHDPYRAIATARSGGLKALMPLIGRDANDSAPWEFWDSTTVPALNHANSIRSNPTMSAAKAKSYIDTIIGYFAPRACVALNLPCKGVVTSTREVLALDTYLKLAPNPATDEVRFESEEINPMRSIELYDMSGRLVVKQDNINLSNYTLLRNGVPHGMYVAKVRFDSGVLAKKLMFE